MVSVVWIHQDDLLLPVSGLLLGLLSHLTAVVTRQRQELVKNISSTLARSSHPGQSSQGTRSISKVNISEFMVKLSFIIMCTGIP